MAGGFLLVAHGPVEEMARAKTFLETMKPSHLDLHQDDKDMVEPSGNHPERRTAA